MIRMAIGTAILAIGTPAFAQTSDKVVPVVTPQTPLDPVAAEKIVYVDSAGVRHDSYWAAIPEAQKRLLMPSAEAFIQVSQSDTGVGFSILPLSASYKKGTYRMLFRWQQFRVDYCRPDMPSAGRVRIGVALEIQADITSKKGGLNIANLGALTAAAERDQVQGSIAIRQWGLGNSSPTLGTYLSNFQLTRDGVTKALEAIAVTKAVLENQQNALTPQYLSVTESSPGSCTARLPTKARPL